MVVRFALTLALAALARPSGAQAPYAPPPPSEPRPSPPRTVREAEPPFAEPPATLEPAGATPSPPRSGGGGGAAEATTATPAEAATGTAPAITTPSATTTEAATEAAPGTTTTTEAATEAAPGTTTTSEAATEAAPGTTTATATPIATGTSSGGPAPEPDAASSVVYHGHEWGLGVIAGAGAGAGMGEVSALADFGRFAVGGMISVGGGGDETGAGVHLVGGPRFRVSDAVRVDLLADLGLTFFGNDGESSDFVSSSDTSGSEEVLPTAGARAGVTFTSRTSGWYLTLGAGVRHVQTRTVTYTERSCPILGPCTTRTKEARYGGTVAGGVLTFGRAYPRRR